MWQFFFEVKCNEVLYFITFYIRNISKYRTFCKLRKSWTNWRNNTGKEPLYGKYLV